MHFQETNFLSTKVIRPAYVWNRYKSLQDPNFLILSWSTYKLLANRFLRVLSQSSYKRLIIGTKLYLATRMSSSSKAPEGLNDSECKKENLGICPPIPYAPPLDLLLTAMKVETLKIKLADRTVFFMGIFTKGSPEDYLQHIMDVLCLIDQKGLRKQIKSTQRR